LDVTNPLIIHGEVVLLVGGNSGQEGDRNKTLPLFYTSYPLVLYITTLLLHYSTYVLHDHDYTKSMAEVKEK
tara:strand:+ start:1634 stop:1849 length:216 start_codon:yes stop_codon:yes gene_type:complete